jgi:hypothetical protein
MEPEDVLDDGLAQEHWGVFDAMTMLQPLGAIPDGPPAVG